ncbi:hypothetical protein BD560DRAFT_397014 [Blakeslea trispora]|nr:hypothetical protein BD560DRAFT_397014 [Blakeslea trispora]
MQVLLLVSKLMTTVLQKRKSLLYSCNKIKKQVTSLSKKKLSAESTRTDQHMNWLDKYHCNQCFF